MFRWFFGNSVSVSCDCLIGGFRLAKWKKTHGDIQAPGYKNRVETIKQFKGSITNINTQKIIQKYK